LFVTQYKNDSAVFHRSSAAQAPSLKFIRQCEIHDATKYERLNLRFLSLLFHI